MSIEWTESDSALAQREGWDLFECYPPRPAGNNLALEKLDEAEMFESDYEAWDHVVSRADESSVLHTKALLYLRRNEPIEYERIMARFQSRLLPLTAM